MQFASGKLDVRVTLQRATTTTDTWGAETPTWSDLATVWASQRRASARETLAAAELSASVSDVFEVRRSSEISDLGPLDRVVWSGRVYDVVEVTPLGRFGLRIAAVARGEVAESTFTPSLDFEFAVNSMYVPLI